MGVGRLQHYGDGDLWGRIGSHAVAASGAAGRIPIELELATISRQLRKISVVASCAGLAGLAGKARDGPSGLRL